jgi:hypothetical protein
MGHNGDKHVHTWVVEETFMYKVVQDSTRTVSAEGYQIISWIWKLDCNLRVGVMGFPTTFLGGRVSCWC